jgi:hypothetical protein
MNDYWVWKFYTIYVYIIYYKYARQIRDVLWHNVVRPCTRPTISRVCVDQIKRFLHNIRTGESMTTFHFHRCRIMGLRKNKYVFFSHVWREVELTLSKFLDFYYLQNFRSDKSTVPLMSFQSNGVPFDQFSWNFMQMIKVCTKLSFDFDDVHVCRLKVIQLYSIKWTLFQILQMLGGSLVMRSWRSCLFLFRLH